MSETHCPTCTCERRVRVQNDDAGKLGDITWPKRGVGTITWAEHVEAWSNYAVKYGKDQSAQRIHERGGFGYRELVMFLGRLPTTWRPADK